MRPFRSTDRAPARLPRSGNAALASAALIQAVLGAEFVLAGLSKVVNPDFVTQFRGFVGASPGATSGPLVWLVQTVVMPNVELAAELARYTELIAGTVLLVTALEVMRRRLTGPLGAQHAYEPLFALLSAAAALTLAGISLVIYVLQGGRLPTINPGYAFGSPIALELLLVPLAIAIAWLEFARFVALRSPTPSVAPTA
jgi:hypothetical protein